MKNTFLFSLLATLVLCYSCNDTGDELCPAEYHMGLFELLNTSIEKFPYKDSLVTIVFKDSLGSELTGTARNLSQNFIPYVGSNFSIVECKDDTSQQVKVFADAESMSYMVSIPLLDIGFNLQIRAAPILNRYNESLVRDIGYVLYVDSVSHHLPIILPPQLGFLLDIRNSASYTWYDNAIPSLKLNGRTFQNVYNNSFKENEIEIYYNNEFGVIGFQLKSNNILYVFDRIE